MAAFTKPRVVGFNHIALEVGDIDEALAFYSRLFRFDPRGKSDTGYECLLALKVVRFGHSRMLAASSTSQDSKSPPAVTMAPTVPPQRRPPCQPLRQCTRPQRSRQQCRPQCTSVTLSIPAMAAAESGRIGAAWALPAPLPNIRPASASALAASRNDLRMSVLPCLSP